MWSKIWNWIKSIFTNWYAKEYWTTKQMQDALENVITMCDIDKNGKVSIKEVVETLKSILESFKK